MADEECQKPSNVIGMTPGQSQQAAPMLSMQEARGGAPQHQDTIAGVAVVGERTSNSGRDRMLGRPLQFRTAVPPSPERCPFVFPTPQDSAPTDGCHSCSNVLPSLPSLSGELGYQSTDSDPSYPYAETEPKYPYAETEPKVPFVGEDTMHTFPSSAYSSPETNPLTDPKYPYAETDPKRQFVEASQQYPYAETSPKYPLVDTEANYPSVESYPQHSYPETDPSYPYPQAVLEPRSPNESQNVHPETKPDYPYPGADLADQCFETEPKRPLPGQPSNSGRLAGQCLETEPKRPLPGQPSNSGRLAGQCLETEPKRPLPDPPSSNGRRFSGSMGAPLTHQQRLKRTSRSQSEEVRHPPARVLLEDAELSADQAGVLNVSSNMSDVHAHISDSSNVHLGTKVIDQRNYNVERLDSHVDNLHQHEHVRVKHEHIQNKHEFVQSKTEVYKKTENIQHEYVQNKHENIAIKKTEVVHNNTNAIYVHDVYVRCGHPHDASVEEPPALRDFADCRRFLETRYTSWTTLSTPLPWYDDMVLDLRKTCVDFSMVSMSSNSHKTFNGIEQLVQDQQPDKAIRIIVEGSAGYGKTTLATKVAFDWASRRDYLKKFSLAFLIFLREFRGGSLDEHIKAHHYPLELKDGDAFLECLKAHQEKVLFIFDGYDELSRDQRDAIDQIMSGKAFVHSGAVLTSRPVAMTFKKYCQTVSLTGFDDSKKSEFVRLVYKGRPQMRIDEFRRVLESDRSVGELAQCPLMCLLLCEMNQRGAFGGHVTKSKLYGELFHYLVSKAVHRRHPNPPVGGHAELVAGYDEVLIKFGEFCMQCLAKERLFFTAQEIPKSCETGRLFEVGFLVQCRYLTTLIGSETYYEPIHKTFMEFLAARYLHSIVQDEDLLKRELFSLKLNASRASVRLVLQYLCGQLGPDAWTIMEQLDAEDWGPGLDFFFSLLHEAGETSQNVAAVCRRLPRDKVTIRGTDKHLPTWALCLSSPACEASEIEFIWEFDRHGAVGTPDTFVAEQLSFWSALQSCANVTSVRVTFLYGHSSEVPLPFMDAMCECMKSCARLTRLAVLHVKAIAPESAADVFLPVITSLSQHVRTCTSLLRLTVEINLSSAMTARLCTGLAHVPRLQTLRLPRLYCDAVGFTALAGLIRRHVSIKALDASVVLVDGPIDLSVTTYNKLNREAMGRNKKVSQDLEAVQKVPLHRAVAGLVRQRTTVDLERPRTGPDEELEYLQDVLTIKMKDERVRVVEGVWCVADQAGSRALYPLPMCDWISHKGGYHALFEAVRVPGVRLESLTVGRESLTKMDFVCLGETIRKSESLTQLTVLDVQKASNMFPLFTALPAAKRLESVALSSPIIQLNDFLFSVFCRCLEHNASLQELSVRQWKCQLESPASLEHFRNLMKNTSIKRFQLSDCRITISCRVDDVACPCAGVSVLNLYNCTVDVADSSVRGAAFLPLLHGFSGLKQLDLGHKSAPPMNDAAVKAFFAGLGGFKTLQELSICGWKYDVANPESAYTDTKASAKKCGRLTKVLLDHSQFTARSAESGRQWLVQAMATGVPHLQELHFSGLMQTEPRACALTTPHVELLAKAIQKARWTGHVLRLYMHQVNPTLVATFIDLTRTSTRVDVTLDGRCVMCKRTSTPQWWRLRPR